MNDATEGNEQIIDELWEMRLRIARLEKIETKYKKNLEMLKRERQEHNLFIESLDDWVWEMDTDGIHTYSNRAVERILGYGIDDVLGHSVTELWTDDSKNTETLIWFKKTLASGNGWKNFQGQFKHKNGSVVIMESTAIPILGSNDELTGYRGIDRDITIRKKTEDELLQQQQQLEKNIEKRTTELQKKNVVLQDVLTHLTEEKFNIRKQITTNIERVMMPLVRRLKKRVLKENLTIVHLLETELHELAFSSTTVLAAYTRLSPREIEICNMVKNGLTSKEIAVELNISPTTVHKHRQRIRVRFGLSNKKTNLRSYLLSL